MDHLESYIFHDDDTRSLDQHLVLGWSLGGHAAWQVIFNEPRVTAAIVVIGCPDYMSEYTPPAWEIYNSRKAIISRAISETLDSNN